MFNMIKKLVKYKYVTEHYPQKSLQYTHLFVGIPKIDQAKCDLCGDCISHCPTEAMVMEQNGKQGGQQIGINYDSCIFCSLCEDVCPVGAVKMSNEFELAQKDRALLRKTPVEAEERVAPDESYEVICAELQRVIDKRFKRSLQVREVSAGSCNGCDYEVAALNNPFNDIERLGIRFVASPRHADMLLVTGPVTRNMELALVKTYNATPAPKLVVAVGACACSGGIFKDCYATRRGVDEVLPVDVYIPGCPPRPQAIIHGLLKAIK